MKTALIFLWTLAIVLGIFTYFAVFGGAPGTYSVNPLPTSTNLATSTMLILPSSTASSSLGANGSTANPNFYGSAFTTPPVTWSESGATLGITGASFENNQLTLTLTVQMAGSPSCVPLNIRLVADESGNLQSPNTPSFSFPDSGNCNGAPGETYQNQSVVFMVTPDKFPLLLTTGGSANVFFEVATTTSNGLQITLPSTSG